MRIDLDSYREILDTLTRNKSRSFLTGFGVFWGVFMLVALIGGGQGLKELLNKNFEGFATNTVMIWAQQTTKAYKGFRKGRWWSMDYKDIHRLRQRVPELDVVAPVLFSLWNTGSTAYYSDRKTTPRIQGCTPNRCKSGLCSLRSGVRSRKHQSFLTSETAEFGWASQRIIC